MKFLYIEFCDLYDCTLCSCVMDYKRTNLLKIFRKDKPNEGHIFEFFDKDYLEYQHSIGCGDVESMAFYEDDYWVMSHAKEFRSFSGYERVYIKHTELLKFYEKSAGALPIKG